MPQHLPRCSEERAPLPTHRPPIRSATPATAACTRSSSRTGPSTAPPTWAQTFRSARSSSSSRMPSAGAARAPSAPSSPWGAGAAAPSLRRPRSAATPCEAGRQLTQGPAPPQELLSQPLVGHGQRSLHARVRQPHQPQQQGLRQARGDKRRGRAGQQRLLGHPPGVGRQLPLLRLHRPGGGAAQWPQCRPAGLPAGTDACRACAQPPCPGRRRRATPILRPPPACAAGPGNIESRY
jgi:hypothetical protein